MKIDVKKIASLANVKINPSEEKKFEEQLSEILGYVEKLNKVDTNDVEITSQVTGLENVALEDKATPSLSQDEALSGTSQTHNGFFKVPAILDNES